MVTMALQTFVEWKTRHESEALPLEMRSPEMPNPALNNLAGSTP